MTHDQILRPNLIIHLDAPTDVIQSKIRERSKTTHPWEANSPVWENTDYIEHCYGQLLKKQYLKTASESSMVLSYDWSDGGDVEVVIEDIERLNMDYHDKYDKQQKDWRLLTEDGFASKRQAYTNKCNIINHFRDPFWSADKYDKQQKDWRLLTEDGFASKRQAYTNKCNIINHFRDPFWSADKLILTSAEGSELEKIKLKLPGNFYKAGYNTILGDPEPFWQWGRSRMGPKWYEDVPYHVENSHDDAELQHEDRLWRNRKAAGVKDWWKL